MGVKGLATYLRDSHEIVDFTRKHKT